MPDNLEITETSIIQRPASNHIQKIMEHFLKTTNFDIIIHTPNNIPNFQI